jgi:indole-3-glycerol phosphate synthase
MKFINFEQIIAYTKEKVQRDKVNVPLQELMRKINDAPSVVPFSEALRDREFSIIAEIKRESPSAGPMRERNVREAPLAYEKRSLVSAVSVLTCPKYFGMSIDDLGQLRNQIKKPILRKDFIVDEYQIYEARAFGADAVLLMANVLKTSEMRRLWEVCKSLGMEALFEIHSEKQVASLPHDTKVCGINSRRASRKWLFFISRLIGKDWTPARGRFEMISMLPTDCVKVAESGVSRDNIFAIRKQGWNAALIGAALLMNPNGVDAALDELQDALRISNRSTSAHIAPSQPVEIASGAHLSF